MKKIIYIVVLAIVSALSFTSCTEETVVPSTTGTSQGGGGEAEDGRGR